MDDMQRHETDAADDTLVVAGRSFQSRLIIGTGKYETYAQNAEALKASGADMITVAVRRVNLSNPDEPRLVDFISPEDYTFLPNTAGCFSVDEAVTNALRAADGAAAPSPAQNSGRVYAS